MERGRLRDGFGSVEFLETPDAGGLRKKARPMRGPAMSVTGGGGKETRSRELGRRQQLARPKRVGQGGGATAWAGNAVGGGCGRARRLGQRWADGLKAKNKMEIVFFFFF
jgi:hypothetical protein